MKRKIEQEHSIKKAKKIKEIKPPADPTEAPEAANAENGENGENIPVNTPVVPTLPLTPAQVKRLETIIPKLEEAQLTLNSLIVDAQQPAMTDNVAPAVLRQSKETEEALSGAITHAKKYLMAKEAPKGHMKTVFENVKKSFDQTKVYNGNLKEVMAIE